MTTWCGQFLFAILLTDKISLHLFLHKGVTGKYELLNDIWGELYVKVCITIFFCWIILFCCLELSEIESVWNFLYHINLMLCISTSEQVLYMPLAVQNNIFRNCNIFFCHKRGKKRKESPKRKKIYMKKGLSTAVR